VLTLRHRSAVLGFTVAAVFLVPQTGRAANRAKTGRAANRAKTGRAANRPHTGHAANRPSTGHAVRPPSVVGLETSPSIRLLARPANPRAGQQIRLVVVGASGTDDVSWDLTGSGTFSLDTGSTPRTTLVLSSPGQRRVGVQVRTSSATLRAALLLTVRPVPTVSAVKHQGSGVKHQGSGVKHQGSATGRVGPDHQRAVAVHGQRHSAVTVPLAHAAGDPGVTIADFHFTPGATTIHAGDTITWTNNGPSSHSATASNGAFNTGVLHKGQSGSHTFTQAGTFSYFCSIHPFMHGTIVVLASTKAASSTTANQTTTPASTSASAASSAGTLPMTGMDVITASFVGLALLGLGLGLRRALNPRPAAERFAEMGKAQASPGVKEGK
jgi:plastocyanin